MENLIINLNPWWKTDQVEKRKLGEIKRDVWEELLEDLKNEKVLSLLGPRRAGKTTLLYHIVNHLLQKGTNPSHTLFLSFDNPKIRQMDFDQIMWDFSEQIREPLQNLKHRVYVLCDEIHKLDDWGNKIKYWQDLGYKIKFIISGSSSARILKGSGESLLGRADFSLILPLSFREFCRGRFIDKDFRKLNSFNKKEWKEEYSRLNIWKQEFNIVLTEYLQKGGFPEIFYISDQEKGYEYLRNYRTLALHRDIIEMKDIKEPRILGDLFDLLGDYIAQRINYTQFAKFLKIKVDTVKKYLTYFEEAYLVYTASVYSKSQIINTRKEKKLFFFDNGMRNASIFREITPKEMPVLAENSVFVHLFNRKRKELLPKLFYWQNKEKQEVDFIYTEKGNIQPIEVKLRDEIKKKDLQGLEKFMTQFKIERGIIITKNQFKEENNLLFIPLWLFLLGM